jgi:glycosyltransferase involved in cell wall biosynthesis
MNVYFGNATFRNNDFRGRAIHIRQFIENSVELGHTIWMESGSQHPDIQKMPQRRWEHLWAYRQMDAFYIRMQENAPAVCKWGVFPYRSLIQLPLMIWEFNTIPEFSRVMNGKDVNVERVRNSFRRFASGCDLAICVSERIVQYVRAEFGIRNAIFIPNGSDPNLFLAKQSIRPVLPEEPSRIRCVWIGSADLAWNDFQLLLDAIELLNRTAAGNRYEFHLIGKDFPVHNLDIPNLIIHGPVNYLDLPAWLASMDIGLVLYKPGSADFNSPLKLFDYLCAELAVISTPQPQATQVLREINGDQLVLEKNSPSELVQLLLRISENPEQLKTLGIKGRELIIAKYNWSNSIRKTYAAIQQLVEQQGRSVKNH